MQWLLQLCSRSTTSQQCRLCPVPKCVLVLRTFLAAAPENWSRICVGVAMSAQRLCADFILCVCFQSEQLVLMKICARNMK